MSEPMLPEADDQVRILVPAVLIHDMRTPLSHIIGYSELLMEQAQEAGHGEYLAFLAKIRAAGLHLVGQLDQNFQSVRVADPAHEAAAAVSATLPHPQPWWLADGRGGFSLLDAFRRAAAAPRPSQRGAARPGEARDPERSSEGGMTR
jgi:phosphoserine phosphatase RsbU/P